jgi:radical SAM protein with 4Fe4S-binding SPASM domain
MKELYRFSFGDDHFALDVREMLFFQVSDLAWEILERYPRLDGLDSSYSSRDIQQTVEALEEAGIFGEQPTFDCDEPLRYLPVSALEVGVEHIEPAVEFLLREPGEHDCCYLTVRIDPRKDGDVTLGALRELLKNRGKHSPRAVHTVVSINGIPPSAELPNTLLEERMRVELHVSVEETLELTSKTGCGVYPPALLPKTIVSLDYRGESQTRLERALLNLGEAGFKRVMIDWLCAACVGVKAETQASIAAMGINTVPFGMSILTSEKNMFGCGAGNRYLAVSDDGDLYPCRYYLGRPESRLGDLWDGLVEDLRRILIARSVDRVGQCGACGIRYLCGGSSLEGSMIAKDYCRTQEYLAKRAMMDHWRSDLIRKAQLKGKFEDLRKVLPTRPYYYMPEQSGNSPVGERLLRVHGNSMRPLITEGDKVLVKPVLKEKTRIGDIVCFGKPVTCHRVVWKWKRDGEMAVWEKGDNSVMGSKIAARDIHGIVCAIIKPKRTMEISRFHWRAINRFIALFSCITMVSGGIFLKIKRSKRN